MKNRVGKCLANQAAMELPWILLNTISKHDTPPPTRKKKKKNNKKANLLSIEFVHVPISFVPIPCTYVQQDVENTEDVWQHQEDAILYGNVTEESDVEG